MYFRDLLFLFCFATQGHRFLVKIYWKNGDITMKTLKNLSKSLLDFKENNSVANFLSGVQYSEIPGHDMIWVYDGFWKGDFWLQTRKCISKCISNVFVHKNEFDGNSNPLDWPMCQFGKWTFKALYLTLLKGRFLYELHFDLSPNAIHLLVSQLNF